MNCNLLKSILIAIFIFPFSITTNAQEKLLYVIFTSIPHDGEGMRKGLPPIDEYDNYQPIVYSVTSLKYQISYGFMHISYKDEANNLEIWDKPQTYLNEINSTTVDWDIVKQSFTHKMDIIRLLRTWKSYDRIFFIDRNDFYTKKSFLGLITQKRMVIREVDKDIDF